jgi:hypothetical protein
MLFTVYTSPTVKISASAYDAARMAAERAAADERSAGRFATVRWADDYNDHSATGRFIVTGRR